MKAKMVKYFNKGQPSFCAMCRKDFDLYEKVVKTGVGVGMRYYHAKCWREDNV